MEQNEAQTPRLLAVGLDSMDRGLVEDLLDRNELPTLARIRDEGCWGALETLPHSLAETSQALYITGCSPAKTGYWSQNRFDPDRMEVESPVLYDFDRQPPYFALGDSCETIVFDLPQLEFHPEVHGLQVGGWGAHSPMSGLRSSPANVAAEMEERYGPHPVSGVGFAQLDSRESLETLRSRILDGLDLRGRVVLDLMKQQPWRLFLTLVCETHNSGHYFWPHEDLAIGEEEGLRTMEEIYRKSDETLGRWIDCAGPETSVVVYSVEGMKPNTDEVPSVVMLAEWALARRFGNGAMEFDPARIQESPEKKAGIDDWVMETWNQRRRTNGIQEFLRRILPPRAAARLDHFFGGPRAFRPEQFGFLSYQHTMWISPYWPQMPVFALPSFSDGLLRVNVKGREKRGLVAEANFSTFCDEITEELLDLRCAETGGSVVKRVIRLRDSPHNHPEALADLVVIWADPCPRHWKTPWGRMSNRLAIRAGSHVPWGFMGAMGPGISPGSRIEGGHVTDIAPTILGLLGQDPPVELEGRDLLSRRAE